MSSYTEKMEQLKLQKMQHEHPNWIWNRSDTHVFLSEPGANDAFKTVVEPGNSFSPGPGTFGVSAWIFTNSTLFTPETMPLNQLTWDFPNSKMPLLRCRWTADCIDVSSKLFSVGDNDWLDYTDCIEIELHNTGAQPASGYFYLVLRSFGAAGGPVRIIESDGAVTKINRLHTIYHEPADDFYYVRFDQSGKDIGEYLQYGEKPTNFSGEDTKDWASGALAYSFLLPPDGRKKYRFQFRKYQDHPNLTWLQNRPAKSWESLFCSFQKKWENRIPIALEVPDERFSAAFYAQLMHMEMASVMGVPRISPVTYPMWWTRDACYQIVAYDRAGMSEIAEQACLHGLREPGKTGFGMEGDGDAELIWAMSEHYLLHQQQDFLQEIYPAIKERANNICHMIDTPMPVLKYCEYVTYENGLSADAQVVAAPSQEGMIRGRMDGHYPLFFVNGFCCFALFRAAMCAEAIGDTESQKYFFEKACELQQKLRERVPAQFGENDRDIISALWPSNWADASDPSVKEKYESYWNRIRCPDGRMHHEELWTYFEVGEAHNRLCLGERDRVWMILEYFLNNHAAPGLYAYSEGNRDENSCLLNWEKIRGWQSPSFVTPHGWTASELFLLLRDCLIREQDGDIIFGSGIPDGWMNSDFQAENLITYGGEISFQYHASDQNLWVWCPEELAMRLRPDFPRPVTLKINKLK